MLLVERDVQFSREVKIVASSFPKASAKVGRFLWKARGGSVKYSLFVIIWLIGRVIDIDPLEPIDQFRDIYMYIRLIEQVLEIDCEIDDIVNLSEEVLARDGESELVFVANIKRDLDHSRHRLNEIANA